MQASHIARLSAFGAVVEITSPDRETLEQCTATLPGYWLKAGDRRPDVCFNITKPTHEQEGERHFLFQENGIPLEFTINGTQAQHLLAKRVDYLLGAYARDCAFLHAGIVVHEGRAILIPGLSHVGKSTLTAALVQSGAHYVSDDIAVIDRSGRAYILNRASNLREDVAEIFDLPSSAHTECLHEGTLPVKAIMLLNYHKSQKSLELSPLSKGETVLRLIANSMNGRHQPETVIHCCGAAVRQAICCEGVRGEAKTVAPLILSHINDKENIDGESTA
ncbi:MAG: hypothetical protein FIA91_02315 [Geobacter sp.]|nr:hypothetical protein [Geobacter sp.]